MMDTISKVKNDGMEIQTLTWKDIIFLVDELAKHIKEQKWYLSGVYGDPRGGTIVAGILAHKLNLPLVFSLDMYTLIVDDIEDDKYFMWELRTRYGYDLWGDTDQTMGHISTFAVGIKDRKISITVA